MNEDFSVDKNNLDEEWEHSPQGGYAFGKELAEAKKERDHAKRLLDLKLAEEMDFVLKNYEDCGLNRQQATSSTFVRNAAIMSKEYQDAYIDFIEKEYTVNVLQERAWAMLAKRQSLEWLSKLFLSDYYTTDTTIPDYRAEKIREKVSQQEHDQILNENPRLKRRQEDD